MIKALAVAENARGQGLGAALLKRCAQLYWQLDFMLLYGSSRSNGASVPITRVRGSPCWSRGRPPTLGFS
ncbi:GNAT family N-acetyltransferase [Streptomyces flavidovirens]